MRRRGTLRAASTVLIVAGILLLLDAGLTVAWQEPVSALYARIAQEQLEGDLREAARLDLRPAEKRLLRSLEREPQRLGYLARRAERRARTGDAIGRIVSKRAKIDFVMVEGTDTTTLRKGPGRFPETAMPGMSGTVAVAGHRTTYQAPFRHLDAFRKNDPIRLEMPYGTFTYRVERTRIVRPDAVWVTRSVGYPRLVLTACHPLYSAAKRIVVFAKLVRAEPATSQRG
jgi:sortase A